MTAQYPPPSHHFGSPTPPQHQPPKPAKTRRWPWIAGIIVAFLLGLGFGSAGSNTTSTAASAGATRTVQVPASTVTITAPAETPNPAPAAAEGPKTTFGPGTYEVNTDIAPGKYKTSGPDGGAGLCYWARLKSTDGDFNAILANGTPQGPAVITIAKTDAAFETNGCTWTKAG